MAGESNLTQQDTDGQHGQHGQHGQLWWYRPNSAASAQTSVAATRQGKVPSIDDEGLLNVLLSHPHLRSPLSSGSI